MFNKISFSIMLLALLAFGYGRAEEKLTPQIAKEKVLAACKLFESQGVESFPLLKNPKGEFRFAGGDGYIWVNTLSGTIVMHPISPELEGKDFLNFRDSQGFPFIVAMAQTGSKYGEGWVIYMWPKPGKSIPERKISFMKVETYKGKKYLIGCGLWDFNRDEIKTQFPKDYICDRAEFENGI